MDSQSEDAQEDTDVSSLFLETNERNQNNHKERTHHDDSIVPTDEKNKALPAGINRLSKWAKRLFDPDRPKGLIQSPQTIPLNDEFLKAFGKREKEADAARGITLQIDRAIDDDDDDDDDINQAKQQQVPPPQSSSSKSGTNKRKVKITNIKFTTTAATLQTVCSNFGPVEYTNLIMDQEKDGSMNTGRAYVTFEHAESAQACVDGLMHVDQRPVTVSFASTIASSTTSAASTRNASASRYWQADKKDLSTKCFRCGGVGHVAANCTNAPAAKPCPLCANTNHEMRNCPFKAVCFNCGIPGHVARDCQQPRGAIPPRRICTICYRTDHHKSQCRYNIIHRGQVQVPPSVQAAVCMSCGRNGHYLCKDLKWFFGLNGVTCCNCGMPGHIGAQCPRPGLDVCCRSEATTLQEIDRARTVSSVEEAIIQANRPQQQQQQQQQHQTGRPFKNRPDPRGRRMESNLSSSSSLSGNHDQRRSKSMPPRGGRQHTYEREQNSNSNNNGNYRRHNQQSPSQNKKQKTKRW